MTEDDITGTMRYRPSLAVCIRNSREVVHTNGWLERLVNDVTDEKCRDSVRGREISPWK